MEAPDRPPADDSPARSPRAGRLPLTQSTLLRNLLIAAATAAVLLVVSLALSPFDNLRLAMMAVDFTALAGLTLLTGLNGQISLGHGALMAVGAYSAALLIGRQGWPIVPTLVAATVITAVVGVVVGAMAARLRGPYLAGATLAFAVGLPGLADRYPSAFGGENGLNVDPATPPASLGADFPLERWEAWIACAAALVAFVLVANLVRSGVGRAFRAVRDDEVAAQLAGLNVARTHVLAFLVSAACAGLAGGAFVVVNQLAAPGAFQLALSLSLLTGVVLGGLGSLAGAVWGAVILVLLPSWTSDLADSLSLSRDVQSNLPLALYGVVLIGAMVAAPEGIQGALRRIGHRLVASTRRSKREGGGVP